MKRVPTALLQLAAFGVIFFAGWVLGQPSPEPQPGESPTRSGEEEVLASSPGEDESRDSIAFPEDEDRDFADRTAERSRDGVIAAAVRFLELTEDAVQLTPSEAGDLQRSISTQGSAGRLAAGVEATLTDVAASVPDGVIVHVAPLGASAREVSGGWEVSIWYVEVAIYGSELAVEQWRTATYTLIWESNNWRMDDLVSVDGPVPVRTASNVASPVSELIALTAGLSDDGWGQ